MRGKNRFGNKKATLYGYSFDSKKEAKRFGELYYLLRSGRIENLTLQPEFVIADAVYDKAAKKTLPPRKYIADFKYYDTLTKRWIVEDVKSPVTRKEPLYRLKRHLFLQRYGEAFDFVET